MAITAASAGHFARVEPVSCPVAVQFAQSVLHTVSFPLSLNTLLPCTSHPAGSAHVDEYLHDAK